MITANENIINKLEQFVRKYYLNELLKGAVFGSILLGALVFSALLFEHFLRLNSFWRGGFFLLIVIALLAVLIKFIAIPTLGLVGLKRDMKEEEAASYIGSRISSIGDSLLNRLQLESLNSNLARAAAAKKDIELSDAEFTLALEKDWFKRLLPWFGAILGLYVLMLLVKPEFIISSGNRILEFDKAHHLIPPFDVEVNYPKIVSRGSDAIISTVIQGDVIVERIDLIESDRVFILNKEGRNFSGELKNLQKPVAFKLKAGKYVLGPYTIGVSKKPELLNGTYFLTYPEYLEKENIERSLSKQLVIPEGTKVEIAAEFIDTDEAILKRNFQSYHVESGSIVSLGDFKNSEELTFLAGTDTIDSGYDIQVIKDQYPDISLDLKSDTVLSSIFRITGEASDDYGLSKIRVVVESDGKRVHTQAVKFNTGATARFAEILDIASIDIKKGNNLTVFAEAIDNDKPNGYKKSQSQSYTLAIPSIDELDRNLKQADNLVEASLEEATRSVKDLQKLSEQIRQNESRNSDKFETSQIKNDLRKQLEEIQQKLKNATRNRETQKYNKDRLSDENRVLEKQQQLDDLIEKSLDKETQDLLKELAEKLEEQSDEVDLEEIESQLDDMLDNLEKNLEMFKRLSVEIGIEESIEKLDQLENRQEELTENIEDDSAKAKQDSINDELNELNKELDELKEKNDDLRAPFEMDWGDEERKDAEKSGDQASSELKEGKKKEAKNSGKSAAAKMRDAQKKMSKSLQDSRSKQQTEDMENLRQISDNLLQLSFNQERVLNNQLVVDINDPLFRDLTVSQKLIGDDFVIAEDSLKALYTRVTQLENTIKAELDLLNERLPEAVAGMESRNKNVASQRQHEAMTSLNNLALLLSEVVQQMQQQMAQSKFGDGACSKPGAGKQGMAKMRSKQESLKKEMERLQKEMEGKSKGKGKKGKESGSGGSGGMSKEIAKMAAQQQAIREAMRNLANEAGQKGGGNGDLKKLEEEMEKVEKDLLNRNLTIETIERQQAILSKMLEVEESLREQEEDNQRESEDGSGLTQEYSDRLKEYIQKRKSEVETLNLNQIDLNPYYEKKHGTYLNTKSKL